MATTYKILGQAQPLDTNNASLYTVPSSTSAIVSTITVSNTSATDTTFRLFAVADGDAAGTDNAIFYDGDLTSNTTISFSLGLTLGAADAIVCRTSTGTAITFQAFGSELT